VIGDADRPNIPDDRDDRHPPQILRALQQQRSMVFGKPIVLDLPGSNLLTFPLSRLRFSSRPVDTSGKGGH